jgi:hypothetical protein
MMGAFSRHIQGWRCPAWHTKHGRVVISTRKTASGKEGGEIGVINGTMRTPPLCIALLSAVSSATGVSVCCSSSIRDVRLPRTD